MAKHDDIAALRETAQYPAVERREAKRKAVARIAVRPFGDYQIVADVERRQHRRRRDAERSEDQAAYRPGKQDQGQDEPDEARRALLFGAFRSGCGLTRAAAGEGRGRPAPHVGARGSGAPGDVDLAAARHQRTRALVDAIEAGAFGDVTGVLHIGIGGSLLGPALLVDALGRRKAKLNVRFLSNIDGAAFDDAVKPLAPPTTLVVVVSKTFTTAETLANMSGAIDWLQAAGISDPHGRLIGVTANPEAALDAGIDETRILAFGDGVGGRYSLWSAGGVSAALALGWGAFEGILE